MSTKFQSFADNWRYIYQEKVCLFPDPYSFKIRDISMLISASLFRYLDAMFANLKKERDNMGLKSVKRVRNSEFLRTKYYPRTQHSKM